MSGAINFYTKLLCLDRVKLYQGDCLDVLKRFAENSIDSCVCDPPYNLGFMGKGWDINNAVFHPDIWRQVLRVLKPGGHLLAFGGTRTFHRLACAIEDAGFEVRDMVAWMYGSGFPKSHDISKAIDKAAGAEREVVGPGNRHNSKRCAVAIGDTESLGGVPPITAAATDAAREWQGWGTALKPALEPICLARKPFIGTIAANVLAHGTGALNLDGCRVATDGEDRSARYNGKRPVGGETVFAANRQDKVWHAPPGRWPANVVHDGSEEVVSAFPNSVSVPTDPVTDPSDQNVIGLGINKGPRSGSNFDDFGSAARFFFSAKADTQERNGSKHPTVKPLDLMRYFVRMVTKRGGLVLDPFAGTGTTGEAAVLEGNRCCLIEREDEYIKDIERRLARTQPPITA
jgi:DNA modification methylase